MKKLFHRHRWVDESCWDRDPERRSAWRACHACKSIEYTELNECWDLTRAHLRMGYSVIVPKEAIHPWARAVS